MLLRLKIPLAKASGEDMCAVTSTNPCSEAPSPQPFSISALRSVVGSSAEARVLLFSPPVVNGSAVSTPLLISLHHPRNHKTPACLAMGLVWGRPPFRQRPMLAFPFSLPFRWSCLCMATCRCLQMPRRFLAAILSQINHGWSNELGRTPTFGIHYYVIECLGFHRQAKQIAA